MRNRSNTQPDAAWRRLSQLAGLAILAFLPGCSTTSLRSIAVTPAAGTEVLSSAGQTAQYKAIGTFQGGKHPPTTEDITSAVAWSSTNVGVATVSSSGVVSAVGSGKSTITATGNGDSGIISGSSDVTVTISSTGGPTGGRTLTSLAIIPGSQTVGSSGETNQYLAIGTFSSAPLIQDVTSQVTWNSSDVFVGKIDATGLATSVSQGSTTITALYTPPATASGPNPSLTTATATFGYSPLAATSTVTLPTITVYKVGLNPNSGTVTGYYLLPGSAGTKIAAINCGPNATASSCTASVPVGVTVFLNTSNTSNFGGWSNNCSLSDAYSCSIAVPAPNTQNGNIGNVTVGAIFN